MSDLQCKLESDEGDEGKTLSTKTCFRERTMKVDGRQLTRDGYVHRFTCTSMQLGLSA